MITLPMSKLRNPNKGRASPDRELPAVWAAAPRGDWLLLGAPGAGPLPPRQLAGPPGGERGGGVPRPGRLLPRPRHQGGRGGRVPGAGGGGHPPGLHPGPLPPGGEAGARQPGAAHPPLPRPPRLQPGLPGRLEHAAAPEVRLPQEGTAALEGYDLQ